jgi:hypothetical protein
VIDPSEWHYVVERVIGDGTYETIYDDLPLEDVQIDDVLSGDNGLSGTLAPEHPFLRDFYGDPKAAEWKTAIWAVAGGKIHGGGIVNNISVSNQSMNVECVGFTGYLQDLPYADTTHFVETEVLDIVRHIWDHVQSQPHGNLGLELDDRNSGILVGSASAQGEFDTESGALIYEDGAYKLAWYQDHNLRDNFQGLLEVAKIDFHEHHILDATGGPIRHFLDFGSLVDELQGHVEEPGGDAYPYFDFHVPTLGRENQSSFIIGENIFTVPDVTRDGSSYATAILYLGSGEGTAMIRGEAFRETEGLRRVSVISDSSIRQASVANRLAQKELAWRNNLGTVANVALIDHPNAPVGSVTVGDTIRLQGDAGWVDLNSRYRVLAKTTSPSQPEVESLTLIRTDMLV